MKTLSILPGCSDHEHATWIVGPVGHSRDSDLVEESNWQVACERLGTADPEGQDHEIHRFGHWAVGWVEEIAYRPGSEVARVADEIRESLDSYAILDEMHYSGLEFELESANCPEILDEVRRAISRQAPDLESRLDTLTDPALERVMRLACVEGESLEGWRKYSNLEICTLVDVLRGAARDRRKAIRLARRVRRSRRGYA